MTIEKPPLGAKPYYVVIPERIEELSMAIARCSKETSGAVIPWAYEILLLSLMMQSLEELRKEL